MKAGRRSWPGWSQEAEQRGANAIVAMRFDNSQLGTNWTEVCAYGTAVFAIPLPEGEPGATGQSIFLTKPDDEKKLP